jgi:hypothetical protein
MITNTKETHTHIVKAPAMTPATCMMCGAALGTYCPLCQSWGDAFCSRACEEDYYGEN